MTMAQRCGEAFLNLETSWFAKELELLRKLERWLKKPRSASFTWGDARQPEASCAKSHSRA